MTYLDWHRSNTRYKVSKSMEGELLRSGLSLRQVVLAVMSDAVSWKNLWGYSE